MRTSGIQIKVGSIILKFKFRFSLKKVGLRQKFRIWDYNLWEDASSFPLSEVFFVIFRRLFNRGIMGRPIYFFVCKSVGNCRCHESPFLYLTSLLIEWKYTDFLRFFEAVFLRYWSFCRSISYIKEHYKSTGSHSTGSSWGS